MRKRLLPLLVGMFGRCSLPNLSPRMTSMQIASPKKKST